MFHKSNKEKKVKRREKGKPDLRLESLNSSLHLSMTSRHFSHILLHLAIADIAVLGYSPCFLYFLMLICFFLCRFLQNSTLSHPLLTYNLQTAHKTCLSITEAQSLVSSVVNILPVCRQIESTVPPSLSKWELISYIC